MKETGMLFSGPMVRAILEWRKTQTRRVVKLKPGQAVENGSVFCERDEFMVIPSPYGQPGDRLWVKETWRLFDSSSECACYDVCDCARSNGKPVYRASSAPTEDKWRPSIFMPRWASRITLEIEAVRVERLNDISENDAVAEGCSPTDRAEGTLYRGPIHPVKGVYKVYPCAKAAYRALWTSINGPESWDANPFVWVIQFRMVKP